MQDYSFTKHRIFQWLGIILAAGIIAVGYWWYQSQASTLNKSPTGSLTSGLVAYWTFDGADLGSTTATDRGSGSNNGTLTNTPGRVKGLAGQALEFFPNGSDSNAYVTMGDPGDGDLDFGSGDFSVVFWMKGKGYSSQGSSVNVPVSKKNSNAGGTAGYSFRYSSANQMIFTIGNGSTDYEITAPVATVADQVWHQYIGIRSGSTAYFYIDGGLVGSIAVSGSTSNSDIFAVGDDSGTERNVNAVIDEVRVYNAALTTAQLSSLYAAVQPDKTNSSVSQSTGTGRLDSGLALYWALDNGSGTSATDSSTNGNTGTLTNMEDPGDWTTGQIGGALDFDGTNEYVTLADPASGVLDFDAGTHYTLSGWFNRDTFTTDDVIMAKRNGTGTSHEGYIVYVDDSTDKLTFEVCNDCSLFGNEYQLESVSTFTATGWHHFAVVWDDSGASNTKLYINGVAEAATATGTFSSIGSIANSLDFRIGAESDNGSPFDGKLDEMRVYSRSLSADEVGQLYRLTSPTGVDTSLKGYWSFNGQDISGTTAYDRSGAGNTGTLTSGPTKTIGKIGQALSFDGTDDYVTMADANSLDITSAISMAVWLKTSDTDSCIMSKTVASTAKCFESASNKVYELGVLSSTIYFQASNGTTTNGLSGSATNFLDNQWHYIVATWDGTTATNGMKLYMDGVVLHQGTATVTSIQSTSSALTFGGDGGTYDYAGLMDEGRLYNRALSAAEIKALYDAGADDKTNSSISQPQGTGRLDSGLAGYWKLDDGTSGATPTSATDSSTNANTGTLTGGPTWTTGQIGSAVDFDGTDDYVTVADADVLDVYDATITGWFNRDTATTIDTLVAKRNSTGSSDVGYIAYIDATTDKLVFEVAYHDGAPPEFEYQLESTTTFTATGWNHFAITYDRNTESNTKIYINGRDDVATATGSFADIGSIANNLAFRIGTESDGGNPFDGKLDEIRLYNRALSADEVGRLYRLSTPTGTDTGLKGYWSFNGQDVSGSSAFDRSGSGNTGTLGGDVTKSLGKIGQGLAFGGTNGIVDMNDINAMDGVANVTLSAWMKRSATNSIVTVGKSADQYRRFNINFYSDGNVYINVGTGSGEPYGYFASNDTNWHHVVVVFDGSLSGNSNRLKAYVDGVATSLTFSGTIPATTNSNSDDFTLGYAPLFGGYTVGKIDEVRLYNRSLTEAQAIALYNQGR